MKKIRMGNREKKVIGGILTILFIAGLHFLVFSDKAKEFETVKSDWEEARTQAQNQVGEGKNVQGMKNLQELNQQFQKDFRNLISTLRLDMPKYYLDQSDEAKEKRRERCRELVNELRNKEEELNTTQLTFLGGNGWKFPEELPEDIQERPARLWDVIARLNSTSKVLKYIDKDEYNVMQQNLQEYDNLLKEIGINENEIEQLKRYGKEVPLLTRLCHYEIIINQKPEDVKFTNDQIRELLHIEYPDNDFFKINKQLVSLIELIEIADQNKIEDISEVYLRETTQVKAAPEEGEEEEEAAEPTPAPRMEINEMMMMEGMGRGRGELGGFRLGGRAETQEPQGPPENLAGLAAPVIITFSGNNLAITNYLYYITHMPRSYELDSMVINTVNQEEGINRVFAVVNSMTSIEGIIVSLEDMEAEEKAEEAEAAATETRTSSPAPPPGMPPGL